MPAPRVSLFPRFMGHCESGARRACLRKARDTSCIFTRRFQYAMIRLLYRPRRTSVTSITLMVDDETAEALRRLAALEKRSEAEIVRTALANYATVRPRPKGIGKYRSGRRDVSAKAREL